MGDLTSKKIKLYEYSSKRERMFEHGKSLIRKMLDQYNFEVFPTFESSTRFTLSENGVHIVVAMFNPLDIEVARSKFRYAKMVQCESHYGKYYRFTSFENGRQKYIIHLTYLNSDYYFSFKNANRWFTRGIENVMLFNEKITKIWEFYGDNPDVFHVKRAAFIKKIMRIG